MGEGGKRLEFSLTHTHTYTNTHVLAGCILRYRGVLILYLLVALCAVPYLNY